MKPRRYRQTVMVPATIDITPVDSTMFSHLLRVLGQYTYTPDQAEHAMVILRGQTITAEEGGKDDA